MPITAVLFDAYGTLFDVYSVTRLAEEFFPARGAAFAALWRDKQIEYSRLRTISSQYRPFSELTRDALRFTVNKLGLSATPEVEKRLEEQYDRLEVFPENRAALERLKDLGLPLGILSNGDGPMLARILNHTGLAPLFDHVLSADAVARFKTAPEVYALGPRAFGAAARDILFVSSNGWDACGASWYGYRTFWINRQGQPAEELGVGPDAVGATMDDVVAYVTANQ